MTVNQVNYVNIGLMLLSMGLAFVLPFELFLFSYAFLGPAHYLTEISWLHDRNYFSPKKRDWMPILLIMGLISLILLFTSSSMLFGSNWLDDIGFGSIMISSEVSLSQWLSTHSSGLIFLAFGVALVFILTKDMWIRIYGVVGMILAFLLIGTDSGVKIAFGVYLPTLIHVYIFTGAFILFGSLKSKSRSGYLSFIVFIICPLICLFSPFFINIPISQWGQEVYINTFGPLNANLSTHLGWQEGGFSQDWLYNSNISIALTRFIAFAYTYHYLNWFSKTSVIKWHEVPLGRGIAVVVLYLASIGLYLYDYMIGFAWLFLLSFMHVLLEFPLNHQSFIGIGKELRARISPSKAEPDKRTA